MNDLSVGLDLNALPTEFGHLSELEDKKQNCGCRLNIVRHYFKLCPEPRRVLEIGVSEGLCSVCLGELIKRLGGRYLGVDIKVVPDVHMACMDSRDFWNTRALNEQWDLIFVDGNHTKESAVNDVYNAIKRISVGGYILVHDIANEKYPDDGPRTAFKDLLLSNRSFRKWLYWHENGWMGVAQLNLEGDVR